MRDFGNQAFDQHLRDRAIQEQYFPGSTFKIITLSAALSEKVMPEPTFYCDLTWDGRVKYGDTASPRFDWRKFEPPDSKVKDAAGDLTPPQALTASCNPFFYEMGARLFNKNPDALVGYARQLGLGGATGLDPVFGEASCPRLRVPASGLIDLDLHRRVRRMFRPMRPNIGSNLCTSVCTWCDGLWLRQGLKRKD